MEIFNCFNPNWHLNIDSLDVHILISLNIYGSSCKVNESFVCPIQDEHLNMSICSPEKRLMNKNRILSVNAKLINSKCIRLNFIKINLRNTTLSTAQSIRTVDFAFVCFRFKQLDCFTCACVFWFVIIIKMWRTLDTSLVF